MQATLQQLLAIEATEIRPALGQATSLIAAAFLADKADVFLYDRDIDTLVALGTSATPMGAVQHAHGLDRLPVANGGRLVEVFATGNSYLTAHADQDPQVLPGIKGVLGVRSMAAAPIEVAGVRRGVLALCSARPAYFDQADLEVVQAVAHWVGLVIHRAELVEQIAAQAAEQGRQRAADEILRVVAHDLGNLLTPARGHVDILRRRAESLTPEQVKARAEQAAAALSRLQRFVSDLLDADRLERGAFTILPQAVDLSQLVAACVASYSASSPAIRLHAPGELVVSADPDRLRQVLDNLLSNALKYSPNDTPVEVTVGAQILDEAPRAVVTVADQGPGISPGLLPRLFTRFATGEQSKGLGLGLYIARRLALAHGGTLTVDSLPGAGARFHLSLPLLDPLTTLCPPSIR
jgi:signal transduction histidine kinase